MPRAPSLPPATNSRHASHPRLACGAQGKNEHDKKRQDSAVGDVIDLDLPTPEPRSPGYSSDVGVDFSVDNSSSRSGTDRSAELGVYGIMLCASDPIEGKSKSAGGAESKSAFDDTLEGLRTLGLVAIDGEKTLEALRKLGDGRSAALLSELAQIGRDLSA